MPPSGVNYISKLIDHGFAYSKEAIQRWQDAMKTIDSEEQEYKFENLVKDVSGAWGDALRYWLELPGIMGAGGSTMVSFVAAPDADDVPTQRIPIDAEFTSVDMLVKTPLTHIRVADTAIAPGKIKLAIEGGLLSIGFERLRIDAGGGDPQNLTPGHYLGIIHNQGRTKIVATVHLMVV